MHEVEELIDEERGWKRAHASSGDGDGIAANRTPKRVRAARMRLHDALQARATHRVRTGQQLRTVALPGKGNNDENDERGKVVAVMVKMVGENSCCWW